MDGIKKGFLVSGFWFLNFGVSEYPGLISNRNNPFYTKNTKLRSIYSIRQ